VDQHVTLPLVPARRAPHLARTFAAETLEAWDFRAEDVEAVQLVVSELVTNAVLHAATTAAILLELSRVGDALRVTVSDDSAQAPQRRDHPFPSAAESGRGVEIVDALADRWGTELHRRDGKTVWCELRTAR
jgi:anti-sigma regulatory factor (Ser/Thr protein kinase)